jgi:hypothetical protein
MKTRSERLIDCLVSRKAITRSALFTLAYEAHGLQREQLDIDLQDFNCLSRISVLGYELFVPSHIIGYRIEQPKDEAEYLEYAALSGLVAHVFEEGGKWLEFPRKQIHCKDIPRSAKGFIVNGKISLVMIDPEKSLIVSLASVVDGLVVLSFKKDNRVLRHSKLQVFEATEFL